MDSMEGEASTGCEQLKVGIPSLPESGIVPEAQPESQTATRSERDVRHVPYDKHDESLEEIVGKMSSNDREEATEAVTKLWEMTVLTRRNRVANQLALTDMGGIALVVDYAVARITGHTTSEDEDAANMALLVLENLSINVQLHHEMAHNGALLAFLIAVISKQLQHAMRVNATKVLVNLTFTSPQLQDVVTRAGAVEAVLVLLHESEPGLVRQGAWLLAHLTAGQGCRTREELGAQLIVLERLRDLLGASEDPVTKARVCEVLCNLARSDVESHANLLRVGVVPTLLALIDPSNDCRQGPEVVAPALLALAALAVGDGTAVLRGTELEPQLVPYLAGILDYSNFVTRDYDMSRVLMAAHTLIFSLGTIVAKDKGLASTTGLPDYAKELLQESGYVSFQQSLLVLSLEQPKYVPASLGKDHGGPHCFVANTSHQVNVELLPLLRHDNARMVTNACARLYQIATCLCDHPEGRLVLTNGSLVMSLRDLLASEHSAVLQAALSLVDALASIPELVPLLVESGIMDAVNDLSDQQPAAGSAKGQGPTPQGVSAAVDGTDISLAPAPQDEKVERVALRATDGGGADVVRCSDPLVKLLAERALVTMFLAQDQDQEGVNA